MELSSALVYSLRFSAKLLLPESIKNNIAKLRVSPAVYRNLRPNKPRYIPRKREDCDNWREKVIVDYIRRVRETEDPQYDEIFGIFNKITPANISILSKQAGDILKERDDQFRLRVTTLLFDKAIKGSVFAGVMADLARILNSTNTEISDDLETHVKMFGTLYDMSETLTFPTAEDADFDNKIIQWSKQKDIRRGYARFLTHLYSRNLVSGKSLQESMTTVIADLKDMIVQAKTEQTEENVTQFADFLFEIAKLLAPTAVELRGLIQSSVDEILRRPRDSLPSLNMRSRFKLEDTLKCVKLC